MKLPVIVTDEKVENVLCRLFRGDMPAFRPVVAYTAEVDTHPALRLVMLFEHPYLHRRGAWAAYVDGAQNDEERDESKPMMLLARSCKRNRAHDQMDILGNVKKGDTRANIYQVVYSILEATHAHATRYLHEIPESVRLYNLEHGIDNITYVPEGK